MQDILYYYPTTGSGGVLGGSGDGSPIDPNQDDAQNGVDLCELNLSTSNCDYPMQSAHRDRWRGPPTMGWLAGSSLAWGSERPSVKSFHPGHSAMSSRR